MQTIELIIAISTLVSITIGILVALYKITSKQSKSLSSMFSTSMENMKSHVDHNMKEHREEFKKDIGSIEKRFQGNFDQLSTRIDSSQKDIKDLIYRETSALKLKDSQQDNTLDLLKDKINLVNEEHLKFRLTVADQYERKN